MAEPVGVVGAGAWGSALAAACRRAGHPVTLWARETELVEPLSHGLNPLYLADVNLPSGIHATADLADLASASPLLMVTPAQHMRAVLTRLSASFSRPRPLVLCSKGIEAKTGALLSEVAHACAPGWPVAILSGPTFAAEVARDLPCALTLASSDAALAERLTRRLGHRHFRLYTSDDPVGAQIGGAVKNILAIASGIVAGLALGENARAALMTRGLAEIVRLAEAWGGRRDTLMGLAGLGDIVLTCSSTQSRNFSLGKAVGEGSLPADLLQQRHTVAEGAHTALVIERVAAERRVSMPIASTVSAVLHRGLPVRPAVEELLDRPQARE